jgi:hypothetical protein
MVSRLGVDDKNRFAISPPRRKEREGHKKTWRLGGKEKLSSSINT